MPIYLLFLQHIIYSLKAGGKAAIVVPTGFLTAKSIDFKIRKKLINDKMLSGVISMPSNIFATTGTNVSIMFLDSSNDRDVVLVDASKLGTEIKVDKNQKTILSTEEENDIIDVFKKKVSVEGFSVTASYEQIVEKNYSFYAGNYFDINVKVSQISEEEFNKECKLIEESLSNLFENSQILENKIIASLRKLNYDS